MPAEESFGASWGCSEELFRDLCSLGRHLGAPRRSLKISWDSLGELMDVFWESLAGYWEPWDDSGASLSGLLGRFWLLGRPKLCDLVMSVPNTSGR